MSIAWLSQAIGATANRPLQMLAVGTVAIASLQAPSSPIGAPPTGPKPSVTLDYGRVPLHFEPGQDGGEDQVRFLARGSGYALFLTPTESVLVLRKARAATPPGQGARGVEAAASSEPPAVVRMALLGANPRPLVVGREVLPGKSNYFIGSDPKKWRTEVPQFARVEYQDVYPGVSLTFHGNERQLEYDFIVSPGADPGRIRLGIKPADAVRLDTAGNLVLSVPGGDVVEKAPVIYQDVGGVRKTVAGRFVSKGEGEVGFEVGAYDADRPLVLDPLLEYSTYLGGTGSDYGVGVAVDASGSAYVAGWTSSTNFPTASPVQGAYGGGDFDAFVTKLNPAGSAIVYSTYLGGSGEDEGNGIAVDAAGNAYVTGTTHSNNFPTASALQPANAGMPDAFVTKLGPAGSIVYSTYLGGSGDDEAHAIAVDASGNAYITGQTFSLPPLTPFPTVNPFQPTPGGIADAFVAKLNASGSALTYSSFLGGNGFEFGQGIAVDASGNAWVTGETTSVNFPTVNPFQGSYGGGSADGFVAKVNAAGAALVYSTYLGGVGDDRPRGVAVDPSGNAYVAGFTRSSDFPMVHAFQSAYGQGWDAFVAKVNGADSTIAYSTYLGGSGDDQGWAIAADASGNAYVMGDTLSFDFPTARSLQPYGGGEDAFVAKLNPSGSGLVYSTYLGGTGTDFGQGIAVDVFGAAYVTSATSSTDFPTVNAVQAAYGGGMVDAFVAKIVTPPPAGDFNGDGAPDIVWRNQATGAVVVWFMSGTNPTGGGGVTSGGNTSWRIVGTPRLNGDDKSDLLWRNQTTGNDTAWFMDGTTIAGTAVLAPVADTNWQIAATADFNGDGKADVVWRNAATGNDVVVFMDGTTVAGLAVLPSVADVNWQIVGAADFSRDGRPDILWRNQATGDNAVWFMRGTTVVGGALLAAVPDPNWVVGGVADYNADDKTDILWRNQATGDDMVWFMDGATVAGVGAVPAVRDTNWRIVGPR